MLIAQFSDLHIKPEGRLAYGKVDTADYLHRAIAHLNSLPQKPDVLVMTGDLVDAGSVQEYERLRGLLQTVDIPWLMIPGNHDDRDNMRAVFDQHPWIEPEGFWQFATDHPAWPVRILGLDTVKPGESGGMLCDQRLRWLDDTLSEHPAQPTLVIMHHPPFVTGIGHMDEIGLDNAEALADILREHPQVELVTCGHLHRCIRSQIGSRAVMTAPSTAHTVQLDISVQAPAMFRMEPPGYLLHWWSGMGLVTHQVHAVESDGPYPFFDDNGTLMI
jgi:3',5'-cyclic AMP phosphodiesterase CpdA